jgi:membrane-associated phospholipid phosphatase
VVFAGTDLPAVDTMVRSWNVWILDAADIHSSVFPSGHVTVAFSAAFAMLLALPDRRRVGWILMGIGVLVLVDTVYGRYHYAADGLAGLAISAAAFGCVLVHQALTPRRRS